MRLMPGGLMIFALHILRRWTAACMRVKAGQLQLELYPIYNNAAAREPNLFMLDLFYSVVTSLYAWPLGARAIQCPAGWLGLRCGPSLHDNGSSRGLHDRSHGGLHDLAALLYSMLQFCASVR
jgi:hypothetical protein